MGQEKKEEVEEEERRKKDQSMCVSVFGKKSQLIDTWVLVGVDLLDLNQNTQANIQAVAHALQKMLLSKTETGSKEDTNKGESLPWQVSLTHQQEKLHNLTSFACLPRDTLQATMGSVAIIFPVSEAGSDIW
uniref:Bm7989 n=1 Tax=Brugia malayi TaxID=6279 RepID=A0A1I9G868_BRUMA|nr:Bm7989 [Brugia malayi]